ncbi:MAG: hypothetical protein A4E62_02846 [Syntrophorhabdus sp. PtaU1.Bin002]|nr:MAG: hypothetical protein A4E62_02846 [Syntrophorhabdus sp. PtaU1.Bin002]
MEDQFGRDPQVRYLRGVFGRMEKMQRELLQQAGVPPVDYRLRRVREAALNSFEKAWVIASRRGDIGRDEEEIATIYIHCLAKILSANRIHIPPEALPANEKISEVLSEVFK